MKTSRLRESLDSAFDAHLAQLFAVYCSGKASDPTDSRKRLAAGLDNLLDAYIVVEEIMSLADDTEDLPWPHHPSP